MRVIFRVDGGYKMGMGHISRCIALAKYIRSVSNTKIFFVTKKFKPSIEWIKQAHFPLYRLSPEANLRGDADTTLSLLKMEENTVLITDIPQLDQRYLTYLCDNRNKSKLVCLDYVGKKNGLPGILINPTVVKKWYPRWKDKGGRRSFLGPSYWILDQAFRYYHNKRKGIKKIAQDVLVSLGGADPSELTARIIKNILKLNGRIRITVAVGPAFKKVKNLRNLIRKSNHQKITIKEETYNLARMMFEADIGILCAGFTLYEAASVGLPSLVMYKVPHQLKTASAFEQLGITRIIGSADKFNDTIFQKQLKGLIYAQTARERMSRNGKKLLDAKGPERVWQIIKSIGGSPARRDSV